MALFPLMGPGKNIVASTRLYGGTMTQFSQTIKRFGWSAKFVDTEDLGAVAKACDRNTRAIFCETIANPGGYVTDIPALAKIADRKGIPLIVDNTTATPYLARPIEMALTLVVPFRHQVPDGQRHRHRRHRGGQRQVQLVGVGQVPLAQPARTRLSRLVFHPPWAAWSFTFHSIAIGCATWA